MKQPTAQQQIAKQLGESAGWIKTARADILRGDRVDALDCIRIAKRKLAETEAAIRATQGLR